MVNLKLDYNRKDLYGILGLTSSASQQQIKRAYLKLAKKFHPDSNHDKNASVVFQDISFAYQTLSDPEKRKNYDQYGFSGINGPSVDDLKQEIDDIFDAAAFTEDDLDDILFSGKKKKSKKKAHVSEWVDTRVSPTKKVDPDPPPSTSAPESEPEVIDNSVETPQEKVFKKKKRGLAGWYGRVKKRHMQKERIADELKNKPELLQLDETSSFKNEKDDNNSVASVPASSSPDGVVGNGAQRQAPSSPSAPHQQITIPKNRYHDVPDYNAAVDDKKVSITDNNVNAPAAPASISKPEQVTNTISTSSPQRFDDVVGDYHASHTNDNVTTLFSSTNLKEVKVNSPTDIQPKTGFTPTTVTTNLEPIVSSTVDVTKKVDAGMDSPVSKSPSVNSQSQPNFQSVQVEVPKVISSPVESKVVTTDVSKVEVTPTVSVDQKQSATTTTLTTDASVTSTVAGNASSLDEPIVKNEPTSNVGNMKIETVASETNVSNEVEHKSPEVKEPERNEQTMVTSNVETSDAAKKENFSNMNEKIDVQTNELINNLNSQIGLLNSDKVTSRIASDEEIKKTMSTITRTLSQFTELISRDVSLKTDHDFSKLTDIVFEVPVPRLIMYVGDTKKMTYSRDVLCPSCKGKSFSGDMDCATCLNAGKVSEDIDISVELPVTSESVFVKKLIGFGNCAVSSEAIGDLVIKFVSNEESRFFQADDEGNLHVLVRVDALRLNLNNYVRIPTLSGMKKVMLEKVCADDQIVINNYGLKAHYSEKLGKNLPTGKLYANVEFEFCHLKLKKGATVTDILKLYNPRVVNYEKDIVRELRAISTFKRKYHSWNEVIEELKQ